MSFEQLKHEVALLNGEEQAKLISYTLQLRYAQDAVTFWAAHAVSEIKVTHIKSADK